MEGSRLHQISQMETKLLMKRMKDYADVIEYKETNRIKNRYESYFRYILVQITLQI